MSQEHVWIEVKQFAQALKSNEALIVNQSWNQTVLELFLHLTLLQGFTKSIPKLFLSHMSQALLVVIEKYYFEIDKLTAINSWLMQKFKQLREF